MKVTMSQIKELILDTFKAGLVPMVVSSPGLGKSSVAKQIAEENNLEFIDIRLSQMDPVDLCGLPMLKGNKAEYIPMNVFPLEGDPLPENKKGFLVLLDELSSASQAVQAAAYRLLLDKEVGQRKLHPRVALMGAGNLITDKAIVNRTGTAMQSRLIHFEVAADLKSFIDWADKNGIDHRIKSFLNFKPAALHNFNPNHTDMTFPCPRSWEFTSKLISSYDSIPETKLPLLSGAIGEGMAREFFAFTKIYGSLPTIADILANPTTLSLSNEPSIHYALTGLLSHHISERNADKLMLFLKRLNIDFQVICIRSAIARDRKIKDTPAIRGWVIDNARELSI